MTNLSDSSLPGERSPLLSFLVRVGMIPVPVLIFVPAGLLVGVLGEGVAFGAVVFGAVGLGYGFGLWALAQRDLLPLLEPE